VKSCKGRSSSYTERTFLEANPLTVTDQQPGTLRNRVLNNVALSWKEITGNDD